MCALCKFRTSEVNTWFGAGVRTPRRGRPNSFRYLPIAAGIKAAVAALPRPAPDVGRMTEVDGQQLIFIISRTTRTVRSQCYRYCFSRPSISSP